jgi:hypothetical protein
VADQPEALLSAADDGQVVVAVTAGRDGRRGNLYRLAVRPGCFRGCGVGRALVQAGQDALVRHLRAGEQSTGDPA